MKPRTGIGLAAILALCALACALPPAFAETKGDAKAAPAKKPADQDGGVVAVIGDEVITKGGFLRYWDAVPIGRKRMYEREGGQKQFLDDLIRQKLLVKEAVKEGLDKRPDLAAEIELAREKILYEAEYKVAVVNAIITEDDIKKYYDEHKESYATPETIHARHILVTLQKDEKTYNELNDDAKTEDEARAKIKKIKELLAAGEKFEDVAKKYSEDPAATVGGDLGFFPRGRMVKPFEDAAFALEVGQVSEVVITSFGYHIIKVEAKKPAGYLTLPDVKSQIFTALSRDRKDQIASGFEQLVSTLKQKYQVQVHDETLVDKPAPAAGEK